MQRKKQNYSRGTTVYKLFDNKYHREYICNFDNKEGYHKVRYEDGNNKEYYEDEIATMMSKLDENNMLQALAAIWHEKVEAIYAETKSSYFSLSMFAAGYAKVMAQIKMNSCNRLAYQGYKYAKVVVDEETGKTMISRGVIRRRNKRIWSMIPRLLQKQRWHATNPRYQHMSLNTEITSTEGKESNLYKSRCGYLTREGRSKSSINYCRRGSIGIFWRNII